MEILGTVNNEDVLALIIDVDGTIYCKDNNDFLKKRTEQENIWLSQKLKISLDELKKIIRLKKNDLKKGEKRVAISQVIFSLGITSKEWNDARNKTLPQPSLYLKPNEKLRIAVENVLKRNVLIIWASNSPTNVINKILETVLGNPYGATPIIGQDMEIAKPNPNFYTKLVFPMLEEKNIPINKVISIGDRKDDDGVASIEAGLPGAIIVNGPKELIEFLEFIVKGDE